LAREIPLLGHVLWYIYRVTLGPEVAAVIDGARSAVVPAEAQAFAQATVRAVEPPSPSRARALLFAVGRLGAFGLRRGLPLTASVLFTPSVIERCCLEGLPGVTAATRRTVRSNLRFVAARTGSGRATTPRLGRDAVAAPYARAELAGYLALAEAQPTAARRRRATALICLGAGAGLIGADLRAVRGDDVVRRAGGVIVSVRGAHPRAVPVRAEFCCRLVACARAVGSRPLIGNGHPRRKNVTSPLVASMAGGADLGPMDVRRLRSTWLVRCAEDLGLRALLDAAGLRCTQRLGDLVADLAPVEEARAIVLLGGRL